VKEYTYDDRQDNNPSILANSNLPVPFIDYMLYSYIHIQYYTIFVSANEKVIDRSRERERERESENEISVSGTPLTCIHILIM
jgi:hypothetical protein